MISTRFCPVCGAANNETERQCFACGHALPEDESAQELGQQELLHGRYRLGHTLGSGGYSAVYRGWDTRDGGRSVAIKRISLRGLEAEEAIEATNTYNREVEALSTLHHPQIPHLYDHFSDPDHWYLVLEYVEGQTLEMYIEERQAQRKPFGIDEVIRLALQLCNVLAYLHACHPPVIFRDLKPDNIMRTTAGKLYLIDFGIARHFTPGQSRDTQSLGSPGYAAPEQYGRAQTDARTDLYGLGALLHQLLSGHDPSETPRALPPLRLNGQPGSAELERLVARLLEDNPQQRPASAREVARELEHIQHQRNSVLNSQRIWQPPTPQNYPVAGSSGLQMQFQQQAMQAQRKHLTRRRVLAGALTGAVLLGGGYAAYGFYRSAHPVSMSTFIDSPGDPTTVIYTNHTDTISSLAWSPDSQRVASASLDRTLQVWDAQTGTKDYVYKGASAALNAVAWSSDDSYMVFAGNGGGIWLQPRDYPDQEQPVSVGTEEIEALAWEPAKAARHFAAAFDDSKMIIYDIEQKDKPTTLNSQQGAILCLSYSSDGWYLASGAEDRTVVIWDTSTHEQVYVVYKGHTATVTSLAWLPNSAYIASASADATVQIWDATNGGSTILYKGHTAMVNALAVSPDGKSVASASDDTTVQVWSVFDGSLILTYQGHSAAVTSVAWSPDGKSIASGSADHTVRVWKAPDPPSY